MIFYIDVCAMAGNQPDAYMFQIRIIRKTNNFTF